MRMSCDLAANAPVPDLAERIGGKIRATFALYPSADDLLNAFAAMRPAVIDCGNGTDPDDESDGEE